MAQRIIIIGGGIGGLGTANLLAKQGYEVTLVEKNERLGGRANLWQEKGYTFDMGPSWYMMPDVFEHYFSLLGKKPSDYFELVRLSPSYRVNFADTGKVVDMESDVATVKRIFEGLEPGAGDKLDQYLKRSGEEYEIAKKYFMYRSYDKLTDFFAPEFITHGGRFSFFKNIHEYYLEYFKSPEILKIMEYIMVFLGGSPYKTPALYAMMNYIDFELGTYYPMGGMYKLIEALVSIGTELGVTYRTGTAVEKILVERGVATGVRLAGGEVVPADQVISNADLWFTETQLLDEPHRTYKQSYWEKRTLAPSAFILYLGLTKKVDSLIHHNFVFSAAWEETFQQIFDDPQLPTDPSIYVCAPSRLDPSVAPAGKENLFVLVPIPAAIEITDEQKAAYSEKILDIIQDKLKVPDIRSMIEVQRAYTNDDFLADYNSFKGSALGLAHTLGQSAIFRPNNGSKKVKNLHYVGAGTNPGIGMPICLMSAEIVYKRVAGIKNPQPLERL